MVLALEIEGDELTEPRGEDLRTVSLVYLRASAVEMLLPLC